MPSYGFQGEWLPKITPFRACPTKPCLAWLPLLKADLHSFSEAGFVPALGRDIPRRGRSGARLSRVRFLNLRWPRTGKIRPQCPRRETWGVRPERDQPTSRAHGSRPLLTARTAGSRPRDASCWPVSLQPEDGEGGASGPAGPPRTGIGHPGHVWRRRRGLQRPSALCFTFPRCCLPANHRSLKSSSPVSAHWAGRAVVAQDS